MVLEEYYNKINNTKDLKKKLIFYQELNWELGLLTDDEIHLEWLPTSENKEEILIELTNETGILTIEYEDNNHIYKHIHDIRLDLYTELECEVESI